MKIEQNKLEDAKLELTIEVSGDTVKNKFEEIYKKISKDAKVPGFRPGNAPRDILEKHYSSYAHEQVLKELIPEIYNQAIEKENLDVVELPEISEVKLDTQLLSFKAKVELMPEIQLKEYKSIKVQYKRVSVTPDEIKRSIDAIKEGRKAETIDDKFANALGYPDVGEFEKAMERQLFIQKENAQRQKIENEIIEAVTKGVEFKIPPLLIRRQLEDLVRQSKLDLALRGVPKEKIDQQGKELNTGLEPQAKSQVKVYMILSEIAKREKIAADEHLPRRVIEFLLRQGRWEEVSKNMEVKE
ncbi:MAG: trigger factor [Candidatus Omnitrophota bacterium]